MGRRRKKAFGTKGKMLEAAQAATLLRYDTSSPQASTHNPVSLGSSTDLIFDMSSAQVLTSDTGIAQGDLIAAGSGAEWEPLNIGSACQLLAAAADGASPVWRDLFDATEPDTIQAGDTAWAGTASAAARAGHQHGITTTSDGQTNVSTLLQSSADGYLRLTRLGAGVWPTIPLQSYATSEQLRLNYDAGGYASFTVADGGTLSISTATDNSTGNLTLAPAGDVYLDPTGNDVLPQTTYDINLGSPPKKYLTLHCAELWVDTLVAASTLATIGGRVLVAPTDVLAASMTTGATTMQTKYNEMAASDIAYMEDFGKVEFMRVVSGPSGAASPYSYTVTRNLDGTGANEWYAGDAVVNTGVAGEGFIDIYSIHGVKAGTEYGPTVVGNVRGSSTFNDWTEHWALGNLNGLYGFSSDVYGVALGKYAASNSHITIDSTNGIQIKQDTATVMGQWDTDGNIRVGRTGAGENNVYIDSSGELQLRTDTTWKMKLDANGALLIDKYGDMFFSDADGLLLLDFQKMEHDGTNWNVVASRGERATLTGALHQEQGRWSGRRSLVVEAGMVNFIENPLLYDGNSDDRGDYWSVAETLNGTPTESIVERANDKGWWQRFQYTGDVSDATNYWIYFFRTDAATFAATNDATFSVDIKAPTLDGVTFRIRLDALDASNSLLDYEQVDVPSSVVEDRYEITYENLPASTDKVQCRVQVEAVSNGDEVDFYFGGAQCEKTDHATTLAHGNAGPGYSWSAGTPHAERTTRTVTEVNLDDYVDLISSNDTLSFRVVARMQYDYDATWSAAYPRLFEARSSSTARIALFYDPATYKFVLYYNGENLLTGTAQSFSAGDWVDLLVTIDASGDEYYLYVNGEQDASSTTAKASPALTEWNIGSDTTGATQGGFFFAEYAVFDSALSADEAAALYARQRPLVDVGSLEKPGVYILDGQFRLSSALTTERVELFPHGIGIYAGSGASGVARLLGGFVDTGSAILDSAASDLGWFGYDSNNDLQVAWYAAGASAGKIISGEGTTALGASGVTVEVDTTYQSNRAYRFTTAGSLIQSLAGYYNSGVDNVMLLRAFPAENTRSQIQINARSPSSVNAVAALIATEECSPAVNQCRLIAGWAWSASKQYVSTDGAIAATCGLTLGSCTLYVPPGTLAITDGISAPNACTGFAMIYVDSSTGDLMVKFGDGYTATIAADSA